MIATMPCTKLGSLILRRVLARTLLRPLNSSPRAQREANSRGQDSIEKKDYDAAIAAFTDVIQVDLNDAHAYYGRGLALSAKKRYGKAIVDFAVAIRIKGNFAEAMDKLAEAMNKLAEAYDKRGLSSRKRRSTTMQSPRPFASTQSSFKPTASVRRYGLCLSRKNTPSQSPTWMW